MEELLDYDQALAKYTGNTTQYRYGSTITFKYWDGTKFIDGEEIQMPGNSEYDYVKYEHYWYRAIRQHYVATTIETIINGSHYKQKWPGDTYLTRPMFPIIQFLAQSKNMGDELLIQILEDYSTPTKSAAKNSTLDA